MSFWKTFGFNTVSAIDSILESGTFTLEQLLDEEDILQETKSQNPKLIDYLSEVTSLKKLLCYITDEPAPDADQRVRFKYPFLACEILASEVWQLIDSFYKEKDLLDQLYSFLDKPSPLNPMMASYTSRVAGSMMQKKVPETIEFLKNKKNVIQNFINHLGNASVMDLLLKVITSDSLSEEAKTLEWLCQTDLISALIVKFDPKLDESESDNASQALVDIIGVSANSPNSPLIKQLESQAIISKLYNFMLAGGLGNSLLRGLDVVIDLLRRHFQPNLDVTTKFEELPDLLKATMEHAPKLYSYLETPKADTTKVCLPGFGDIIPLGFHRLKIVEFFCVLVKTNYICISQKLIQIGAITRCLSLFFEYPWNNFLHSLVCQMIEEILSGQDEDLKLSLFNEGKLLDLISTASKENEQAVSQPKGFRRGHMGYITNISIVLEKAATVNDKVAKLLAEHKAWQSYKSGPLAETRKKQTDAITEDEEEHHDPTYHEEEEEE